MKIVLAQFYSNNPTPVYNELAIALRTQGHTVLVGTPDKDGNLVLSDGKGVVAILPGPAPTNSRVPIVRQILRRVHYLLFLGRVKKFLREFVPDIVQVNKTMFSGYVPMCMPSGMFFVFDVRQLGLWGNGSVKGRIANLRALKRIRYNARYSYNKSCFASTFAAERALGMQWRRWGAVTPIGVDKQFLTFQLPPDIQTGGKRTFVYIGTIGKMRNLELLLNAAAEVLRQNDRFSLTLIGPGDDREYYNGLIHSLGLTNHVYLGSPVPYQKIPETIARFDVAIAYVPNVEDWQYQPTLKVLEYRAMGIPIVATDNPPNREVVEQEVNGILTGNSPLELSAGMLRFIDDVGFFENVRSRARLMRSGRTWDDVANIHVNEVYRLAPRWKSQPIE